MARPKRRRADIISLVGRKVVKINNPLQMNDWEIGKFLKVVLAVQFTMWGAIVLDAIGLQIPILRELIGFFYLTFVPGIIILRILKLHKLGNIETILYTVGLSIATLMFTGLFMNTVYPLFGISGPISIVPLIITISVVVLVLCVLGYVRDRYFSDPSFIDIKNVLSPPALFLCLLPFLSIFGTYLVNFHQNNILLMFLIIIIALIVLLIGFDKFIPKNLYPLAVFIIALSLLYHRSLISMYLTGYDIHFETYLANLVTTTAHWDSTIPSTVNAMLSIVMLAPIFSDICSMSLTWVFKIIYPVLFSLIPLGLYRVFQKQTDDKIAFLSCFFFMSVSTFYTEMLSLARQEICELFFVLLILAMIDRGMNKVKRSFLFIVFGISLAVSHYGTSYVYMFCLIAAWLIVVSIDEPAIQKVGDNFYAKISRYKNRINKFTSNPISSNVAGRTISTGFVSLFVVFVLSWYMYVSSSSAFNALVQIGDHVASSIYTDFLNPEAVQGLDMMLTQPQLGLLHEICRIINYLNQIFIIIGCIVLLKYRELKFETEYAAFSMINLGILFAAISVPHLTAINMTRSYHLALIFLAPFCVIGGITVFRLLSRIVRVFWTDQHVRASLKVLSVYFVIFLLYSSGFVYQVAEGQSGSISIGQEGIKKYGDAEVKAGFYSGYIPEQDVVGVMWLSKNRDDTTIVYADFSAYNHLLQSYGMLPRMYRHQLLITTTEIETGSYIFMRYLNVIYNICLRVTFEKGRVSLIYNTTEIEGLLKENCKIYSNGGCNIHVNS